MMTKPYILYDRIKDRYIKFHQAPEVFVAYGVTDVNYATINPAGYDPQDARLTAKAGYYPGDLEVVPVKVTVTIDN